MVTILVTHAVLTPVAVLVLTWAVRKGYDRELEVD